MANTYFYDNYYTSNHTDEDAWYSDENNSNEKEYYYKTYNEREIHKQKKKDIDYDGLDECLTFCNVFIGNTCKLTKVVMYLVIFIIFLVFLHNTVSNKFNRDFDYNYIDSINGNSSEAIDILEQLCNNYRNNVLTGDSCNEICNIFTSPSLIKYEKGKNKHVIILNFNTTKRIFKASKKYFSNYKVLEKDINNNDFIKLIFNIINNHTMLEFPLSHSNHIINMIYPPFKNRSNKILTIPERETIWRLTQQPEYINYKILKLSRVLPSIVSSCGHFYEVENIVPFSMKSHYLSLKNKILIHLMGTAKLFYEFLNEPLEWCDVKFNNLGLSQNYGKRFLLINGDNLYTKSKLQNIFANLFCTSDNDCILGDCISTCNNVTNTCNHRNNENLDLFCDKMIASLYGKYYNKNNKFLSACFGSGGNKTKRLNEFRLAWAWNLPDV